MAMYADRIAAAFVAASFALAGPAFAAACRAASGSGTTPLVELYTSEGCDSCPPADRWLSANFAQSGAPTRPLALAFHVDYWDRLGWTDRFAAPAWTARQYASMRADGATFVYTPQVLLQGHAFAGWRGGTLPAALDDVARRPARASIEVAATVEGERVVATADARVADAALRRSARLAVAYVDHGLVSNVTAGENRGVRLAHDHVVRALHAAGDGAGGAALSIATQFTRPREPGAAPTLVAFVQDASNGDVLQAVALPLSDCRP